VPDVVLPCLDEAGALPWVLTRLPAGYRAIVADNGSAWYMSGVPDSRWNNDLLQTLGRIKGSDFRAVDTQSLVVDPNSGQVRAAS